MHRVWTLFQVKVSLDRLDVRGRTPLRVACEAGELHPVRVLLEVKAASEVVDLRRRTPGPKRPPSATVGLVEALVQAAAIKATEEQGSPASSTGSTSTVCRVTTMAAPRRCTSLLEPRADVGGRRRLHGAGPLRRGEQRWGRLPGGVAAASNSGSASGGAGAGAGTSADEQHCECERRSSSSGGGAGEGASQAHEEAERHYWVTISGK